MRSTVLNAWEKGKEERKELDACGVVSFACTQPVPVESIQTACQRMQNRGNGRGGGVLGLGGMFSKELEDYYAFQIIVLASEEKRSDTMLKIAAEHLMDFDIFDRAGTVLDIGKLSLTDMEGFRNPRRQKDGKDVSWEQADLTVDPGDMYRFFVQ